MVSHIIHSARAFIDVCRTKGGMSPEECALVLRALACAHEQAQALEAAQVPRRQRLTEDDFRSGKVVLLPIIPRNEAVRP